MTEASSTAATFIERVREIYDSSTPNLIWEVGTPVKILRGHLSGFGPVFTAANTFSIRALQISGVGARAQSVSPALRTGGLTGQLEW